MTAKIDIPDDDPARHLRIANPDAADATHLSVVGDTYTILVSGDDTGGRYSLIDMHIPDGGGPPPHRHDFEESFTLLEGQLEFTFRGETRTVTAPATVHIPANAPHGFANRSGAPVRALCICAPAGQEKFFAEIGDTVDGRTAAPPDLSKEDVAERIKRAADLAPHLWNGNADLTGPCRPKHPRVPGPRTGSCHGLCGSAAQRGVGVHHRKTWRNLRGPSPNVPCSIWPGRGPRSDARPGISRPCRQVL